MRNKIRRVIVAMSGGIDSSVATALLKRAGFDVVGIFMKLDELKSSKESEKRAKTVAKKLGISFQVLDFRKEFKKKVIEPFIEEYKKGRTPNPCVVCNKEIKFKLLFNQLSLFKADFFATGHYVRIKNGRLLKGRDKNKDQSYFLWQLTPELLNRVLFPVGGYIKKEVEQLAKDFELPFKDVSDSQEICFAGKSINNFLEKHLKMKKGKIVNIKGEILGEHRGLWFYTIGQRKGIELSGGLAFARLRRAFVGNPFHVLNKDIKENLLVVTQDEKDLYKKELIAKNVNWISGKVPELPLKAKVKIRYRHRPASAVIKKHNSGKIKVIFDKPQRAITPGQSVVFCQREELLGGGIINKGKPG